MCLKDDTFYYLFFSSNSSISLIFLPASFITIIRILRLSRAGLIFDPKSPAIICLTPRAESSFTESAPALSSTSTNGFGMYSTEPVSESYITKNEHLPNFVSISESDLFPVAVIAVLIVHLSFCSCIWGLLFFSYVNCTADRPLGCMVLRCDAQFDNRRPDTCNTHLNSLLHRAVPGYQAHVL